MNEALMIERGKERYRKRAKEARLKGRETATPAGRFLLRKSIHSFENSIVSWVESMRTKRGPKPGALSLIEEFEPGLLAVMAAKVILDKVAIRSKLLSVASGISATMGDERRFRTFKASHPKLWKSLEKNWKGTATWGHRTKAVKALIVKEEVEFQEWEKGAAIRMGIVLIDLFRTSTGLIDVVTTDNPLNWKNKEQRVVATPQCLSWLEQAHEEHEVLHPYWMPLTTVPLDWTDVCEGGYRGREILRQPVVKTRSRKLVEELGACDLTAVYSALNAVQRTGWEINEEVLEVMQYFWDMGVPVGGMPSREESPKPQKPADFLTNRAAKAAWKREAAANYTDNIRGRAGRLTQIKLLSMAREFLPHTFYFPMQLDFRGRAYVMPSFLDPQGTDSARGLLRFSEGADIRVGSEGERWFHITGANLWGVKGSYDARVLWAETNWDMVSRIHDDPIDCREWEDADSPWQFLAWCLEAGQEGGVPYRTKIPCHLDGSNNGLQILSILGGDPDGAKATNCTVSDTPQDIYQDVADLATAKLVSLAYHSLDERDARVASAWLMYFPKGIMPRSATKRTTMTQPYASTKYTANTHIRDWYREYKAKVGYSPFEDDYWPCRLLTNVIWEAIEETVSGAKTVMAWLQECATLAAKENTQVRWVAPSGLPMVHDYRKHTTSRLRATVGGVRYEPHIRHRTNVIDSVKARAAVVANFVHACDAAAMTEVLNLGVSRGITSWATIHDSFATTADKVGLLSQTIRDAYITTFQGNLLQDFKDQMQLQVEADLPPVPERGPYRVEELKDSLYFFS